MCISSSPAIGSMAATTACSCPTQVAAGRLDAGHHTPAAAARSPNSMHTTTCRVGQTCERRLPFSYGCRHWPMHVWHCTQMTLEASAASSKHGTPWAPFEAGRQGRPAAAAGRLHRTAGAPSCSTAGALQLLAARCRTRAAHRLQEVAEPAADCCQIAAAVLPSSKPPTTLKAPSQLRAAGSHILLRSPAPDTCRRLAPGQQALHISWQLPECDNYSSTGKWTAGRLMHC